MEIDLYLILGIWLLLGVISASLVYLDMKHRGRVELKWTLLCLPLSVLGFFVYFIQYDKEDIKGRQLPPKPEYDKPEYKFEEPQAPEKMEQMSTPAPEAPLVIEETKVDEASEQVEEIAPEPAQIEVVEEELSPEPPPVPMKHEEERPAPKPKVHQIEGIPRCPNCGAAVSSYDVTCPRCGAKLKD